MKRNSLQGLLQPKQYVHMFNLCMVLRSTALEAAGSEELDVLTDLVAVYEDECIPMQGCQRGRLSCSLVFSGILSR